MRPRADTRRRGALRAQATYSVSALARVANVSSWLLLRVLRGAKVELIRSGRCVLVPVREIQTKLPVLWKSIELVDRLRRGNR